MMSQKSSKHFSPKALPSILKKNRCTWLFNINEFILGCKWWRQQFFCHNKDGLYVKLEGHLEGTEIVFLQWICFVTVEHISALRCMPLSSTESCLFYTSSRVCSELFIETFGYPVMESNSLISSLSFLPSSIVLLLRYRNTKKRMVVRMGCAHSLSWAQLSRAACLSSGRDVFESWYCYLILPFSYKKYMLYLRSKGGLRLLHILHSHQLAYSSPGHCTAVETPPFFSAGIIGH